MKRPIFSRFNALLSLIALAVVTALIVAPSLFISEAQQGNSKGKQKGRTPAEGRSLPNYDIRSDKSAHQKVADLRGRHGKSASDVADLREGFVRGEEELKGRVKNLKVDWEPNQRRPEVIAPDVSKGKAVLAKNFGQSRAETVRSFVGENSDLFGLPPEELDQLETTADYKNPEGGMSFVRLEQKINGVRVFAGEVKAGFSGKGDLVRVVNNLAAGARKDAPSNFGDSARALEIAAENIGSPVALTARQSATVDTGKDEIRFGESDFSPTARKTYFQTEPGVLVPAWEVVIWEPTEAYYLVVDAESGEVLWRKNISSQQTQAATYNVYVNPNSMINVAENPAPLTPGPISPALGTQGTLQNRANVTLIGNEAPYTFNNLGWINDGQTALIGNNAVAGPDRDCQININTGQCNTVVAGGQTINIPNNGIEAPVVANTFRNFAFDYNPAPGDPGPGSEPLFPGSVAGTCTVSPAVTDFQKGASVQLFYITNRYHDEMYRLGFTEAAGNFQNNNFGRGGQGNDWVSAEAQDCSGANNANFSTPPDGISGRMQMYVFTGPAPDRDGSLDADIVIHELTHGLSNRLHGNAAGLATNMSGGMGEGWGDFYAHAMLSEPSDPINGIYPSGGYATYSAAFPDNYYYGVRRFPKAVMAFTGGPNNRPHNPLTFADIDQTRINMNDGAFAPQSTSQAADQVHAAGEVWSSMLWEVRAKFVTRLGWADGNRRILQFVTDGMKLSPINPTFVDGRNAIIAAALASGTGEDVRDIWEGFAIRGLGASALVTNPGSGSGTARVVEAFDLPNLTQSPEISVSDSTGDNDGFAEPGETVMITVPLTNTTGNVATNVTAQIGSGSSVAYGSIAHNGTASNQIRYTIPAAACGTSVNITINVNSNLGPVTFVRSLRLGAPVTTFSENFDGIASPIFPAGWTVATEGGGTAFVTTTAGPDTAPNSAFALDPTTVGGATSLTSPEIPIQALAATVSFRNKWNTEEGWDGGVLEVKIGGGAFQDIIAAGGTWVRNGYNSVLGANGTNNPLNGRNAWSGNSGGYVTTIATLPTSAAGQNVQLRWRFGADNNTAAFGWNIDTVSVVGQYSCSSFGARNVRSDFDGDGRTDLSVFRPSNGIWYLLGTTQGFFGYQWGVPDDVLVPADYDQDGKTDVAIYRPGSDGVFFLLKSNGFVFSTATLGTTGDIPVVRDYDGDTLPDPAVYRPSDSSWHINKTTGGTTTFTHGLPGDTPIAGDFDGDGKGDATVYRNGVWLTLKSSGGTTGFGWGVGSDQPVPADYDGDGKDDVAIFRPGDGTWWIFRSSDFGYNVYQWGSSTDVPVPGDYDGDQKADPAIYRGGVWWILKSSGGHFANPFGVTEDRPTMKGYIP